MSANVDTKACSACGEAKGRDGYSKKQWIARSVRRCAACVASGAVARVPAAPAAPAPVAPAVPDDLDTGPCPICLAEIPAAGSWDDAQYVRLYCCGTRMCLACGERSKAQEKGDTCPCCKAPLPRSLEESFEQTRRVAARGVAWAEHQLAAKYERGMGVGKSISQAQKWYERAAARGYTNSMHSLGVIAHEHRGDVAAAVRYYERAAAGGDAKAMYNLFGIYKDGAPPVEPCRPRAMDYLRRSAECGFDLAQSDLGYMYHHGEGVEASYDEALRLYKLAARRDNVVALLNLGSHLLHHPRGEARIVRAIQYARRAADLGSADARRILAQFGQLDDICAQCGKSTAQGATLARCTGCKVFSFCGQACLRAAWKSGHKRECRGDAPTPAHTKRLLGFEFVNYGDSDGPKFTG